MQHNIIAVTAVEMWHRDARLFLSVHLRTLWITVHLDTSSPWLFNPSVLTPVHVCRRTSSVFD